MIHVDRSLVPKPASLDGLASKGALERQEVIQFYADPLNQGKEFPAKKYKAYKDDEVKRLLNLLFHIKCAYCESNYGSTQPVEVEHYRPKAGVVVKGKLVKPGYYWLAADWHNLLPSCIDCNRRRKQEFADGDPGLSGKANLFPLASETRRARLPGHEVNEEPLLLNPCHDQPEAHLEFLPEGIVRARRVGRRKASEKGATSIKIYGLQRKGLVDARRDRLKFVYSQAVRLVERRLFTPADVVRIAEERAELESFCDPACPYAGMSHQVVAYVQQVLRQIDAIDALIAQEAGEAQLRPAFKLLKKLVDPSQPFSDLAVKLRGFIDLWMEG